jgi:membrane protease YdiL (CAAX protease family)
MKSKWLAPILPYFVVWMGLFIFKNAVATLLGFHLAIVLSLAVLRPTLPFNIFIKPAKMKHVILSLLLCATSGFGLYLFRDVFGISHALHEQLALLGLNDSTWFGFIAYFSIANPFFEEYFWRGILGSDTKKFYVGDLIYAGYHVMVVWGKTAPWSIIVVVLVLTLVGWFWRQLYRRDGSLLAPVLSHMVADLSILLAVVYMANRIF